MDRALVALAYALLAFFALAQWRADRLESQAGELKARSLDAAAAFAVSLSEADLRDELSLLDARRARLLSAARWGHAGPWALAVAFAALTLAWAGAGWRVARAKSPPLRGG